MTQQVQLRRGTAAEHESFTGAVGEVTVVTDDGTLRIHDGATPGGLALQKARAALATAPASDPSGIAGATAVTNIVALTQADYDAIATPDAATLYYITDAT
jgi:hypothetical protein